MTLLDYFAQDPRLASQWDGQRNEADPAALSGRDRAKAWWRCGKGHSWQATVDSRVSMRRDCPYCAGQAVQRGENDLLSTHPRKAALWHPERNGSLTPDQVSPGSRKRIWWRCEKGHEWQAAVFSLTTMDSGCPYCAGKLAIPGETDLATTHPHFLPLWHPDNTLTPRQVTAGSHRKALWRCERGHVWEAVIASVAVDGCGCPYCAGKRAIPGETDLATLCPEIAAQWDEERNSPLTPRQVMPSGHDKVWWKCNRGHHWQAVIFSRTKEKGAGCPYCTGRKVLAGFNDLAHLKPKLAQQWHPTLNGALNPTEVTLGSNKKAWWQCADGHVWQAAIYSRTRAKGTGCPVCAGVIKKTERSSKRISSRANPQAGVATRTP